jgi:CheY-like chemotaxis protein
MRSAPASGAALYVEETERWFAEGDAEESAYPDRPATDFLQPERPAHAPTIEKILLVDDNRDMREYLLSLLTDYDVHAVGDGQAALEAALSEPFSLVLTDVMLPGLDGLELTRALRAHPELRETPVLMLSARAGESARVEGVVAGADIYLS